MIDKPPEVIDADLYCIQIVIDGSVRIILGAFESSEVESWLSEVEFVKQSASVWKQNAPMTIDHCGVSVPLENAEAHVHILRTPAEVNFRKL